MWPGVRLIASLLLVLHIGELWLKMRGSNLKEAAAVPPSPKAAASREASLSKAATRNPSSLAGDTQQ